MSLLLLQFSCFIMSLIMVFLLAIAKIYVKNVVKEYERSRMLLLLAMSILSAHYLLQMIFGFRSQGDDVGALINILFYSPFSLLISYSLINITSKPSYRKKHVLFFVISYALILATFASGLYAFRSLHMGILLVIMDVLYMITIISDIIMSVDDLRKIYRKIEAGTGSDLMDFNIFIITGYLVLCIFAFLSVFIIFSSTWLMVLGPIIMLTLFFFIINFVFLGFTIKSVTNIIENDEKPEFSRTTHDGNLQSGNDGNMDELVITLSDDTVKIIEKAINDWKSKRGYKDPTTSIASLSSLLKIRQQDFSIYLLQCHSLTFRIWLSKMRLEAAKQLLIENPDFNNEMIAEECGFTSRNYFQNMFKSETGLTPREWKLSKAH